MANINNLDRFCARVDMQPKKFKLNRNSQYFEGILQLRKASVEIMDFIVTQLKTRPDVFVSKEVKVKDGLDIYLSSQRFLQSLGHKLKQRFGGTLKVSHRIHTRNRQTSKEVYRINVFFEPHGISRGNIIKINGTVMKVSNIAKMIQGTDLKTGKKMSVEARGADYSVLELRKTKISRLFPWIEVIHPDTFQSVRIENELRGDDTGLKPTLGKNVDVVIEQGIWLA